MPPSSMSPPQEPRELPVQEIEPNLSQPRRYFDEATLDALAASIGERGVLQPVLVRILQDGRYQLVVGERRWRGSAVLPIGRSPAAQSADSRARPDPGATTKALS
jgi:ParB family chromosome partitioning protein